MRELKTIFSRSGGMCYVINYMLFIKKTVSLQFPIYFVQNNYFKILHTNTH